MLQQLSKIEISQYAKQKWQRSISAGLACTEANAAWQPSFKLMSAAGAGTLMYGLHLASFSSPQTLKLLRGKNQSNLI